MSPIRLLLGAAAPLLLVTDLRADFVAGVVPPFRGAPCTTFDGFEVFTAPHAGANVPDLAGSDGASALVQTVPGAILTSAGNIYHPALAPQFQLDAHALTDLAEVVLQVASLGNPHAPSSFSLAFVDASGATVTLAPDATNVLLSLPQQREELLLRWDLAARPEVVTSIRIAFAASAANSSLDALHLDLRAVCPPGAPECFGDGSLAACPCGNTGAAGHGCANSLHATGARLDAAGIASTSNDTLVLHGSGMPNSSALYFQGTSALTAPFGDGLRCAGGTIVRLGTRANVNGASQYPGPSDVPVSVRGNDAPGDVRIYQVWYRNAATFCTSSTFNLSNAYRVAWSG